MPLRVTFDISVPNSGAGTENAVEDAIGVRGVRERITESEELGHKKMVLVEPLADDTAVDLFQRGGCLAGSEESADRRRLVGAWERSEAIREGRASVSANKSHRKKDDGLASPSLPLFPFPNFFARDLPLITHPLFGSFFCFKSFSRFLSFIPIFLFFSSKHIF